MTINFVLFKMSSSKDIDDTETVILSAANTCILDSICLSNQTNNAMAIDIAIRRTGPETFIFKKNLILDSFETKDALLDLTVTLEPNDELVVNSDFSTSLFSTFVSYRELTELP